MDRTTDWAMLQDPTTTAGELARIAAAYPEFADAVLAHPNCYEGLREWIAATTAIEAPAIVAPVAAAPTTTAPWPPVVSVTSAAPTPGALAPDYGTRREHIVWGVVAMVWVLAPTLWFLAAVSTNNVVVRLAPQVIAAVAVIAAAIITGRTTGRRVGGAFLGLGTVLGMGSSYMFGIVGLLAFACLVLAWMVATRRSGLVALAIIAQALVSFLIDPFVRLTYGWLDSGWIPSIMVSIVTSALPIAAAIGIDRLRARPRATADARRAGLAPVAAQGSTPTAGTNTLAVLSLIFALVIGSVPAIVLGHIAHGQIKRTGEQGRGLATAGLVIGYIGIGFTVIAVIGVLVFTLNRGY